MELSSEEGEIPIPINSGYGGGGNGHMIHHDHYHHHHPHAPHNNIIQAPSSAPQISSPIPISTNLDDQQNGSTDISAANKKMVKYKECLKNHAAAMGGNATDGCGEFMPSGEEGTIEALNCSACNCHRNFHRKEIEGEQQQQQAIIPFDCYYHHMNPHFNRVGRKMILGHHKNNILAATPEGLGYRTPTGTLVSSRGGGATVTHPMIMPHNMMGTINPWESEEHEHGVGGGAAMETAQVVKKRSRTKFTQEQKEKMFNFAEKVGWKMQKQEESVVQQLCQEIGVKRRVLKVWMHNNKHNLAKKNININPPPNSSA